MCTEVKSGGSPESGDGCRDEAVEVLSRSGPNEMLPSPRGKFLNRWSPVCPGQRRSSSLCGSVKEGNWQPIICSAKLSG